MNWAFITTDRALQVAIVLWYVFSLVWLAKWFGMKRAKKSETAWEHAQHFVPVVLAFWLLFLIYLGVALSYAYLVLDFFDARRSRPVKRDETDKMY